MKTNIPKEVPIYLPQTWEKDLKKHLQEHPTLFNDKELDYFKYIGQLPYYIAAQPRDKFFDGGFVPISKKILASRVHDYRKYMDFMIEHGLLEEDRHYIKGEKCRGLRYPEDYLNQAPVRTCITKRTLIKSLFIVPDEDVQGSIQEYEYLKEWLKGITIDKERAKAMLAEMEAVEIQKKLPKKFWSKRKNGQPYRVSRTNKKYDDIRFKYNVLNIIVDRIASGDFSNARIDTSAGRFHSYLTILKKELRVTITYQGQRLVSVDIANSQPFLLVAILNPFVFSNNTMDQTIFKYNRNLQSEMTENPEKFKVWINSDGTENQQTWFSTPTQPSKYVHDNHNNTNLYHYKGNNMDNGDKIYKINKEECKDVGTTMFVNFVEQMAAEEDVKKYIKWVVSGQFYENFGKELKERKLTVADGKDLRNEVKALTIAALYERADAIKRNRAVKVFQTVFPSVYKIIQVVKYGGEEVGEEDRTHAALALAMQSLEAEIILKYCCGTITAERPDLPIFTIHDSIVTTEGNEGYVQSVMERQIARLLDYVPKLKTENWF